MNPTRYLSPIRSLLCALALVAGAALAPQAQAQSNVTVTGGVLVNPTATVFATSNASAFWLAISNNVYSMFTNAFGYADTPRFVTPQPTTVPAPYLVTLGGGPTESFYYTINGSTPTTSSTLYTVPFWVNTNATIQVLGTAPNRINAAVVSATYTTYPSAQGLPVYWGESTNTSLTTSSQVTALQSTGVFNKWQGTYGFSEGVVGGYIYFAWPDAWGPPSTNAFVISGSQTTMAGTSQSYGTLIGNGWYATQVTVGQNLYDVYRTAATNDAVSVYVY